MDAASAADCSVEQLIAGIHADLESNHFKLPSLPDTTFSINRLINQDDTTADDIAHLISTDPAIALKLIKACNGPLYRGVKEINTCGDAVVRLGMETTRQLVTVFSMRELFKSKHSTLEKAMTNLWEHSRGVAAVAYVLTEMTKLDSDNALLAGLIHEIGAIPVT